MDNWDEFVRQHHAVAKHIDIGFGPMGVPNASKECIHCHKTLSLQRCDVVVVTCEHAGCPYTSCEVCHREKTGIALELSNLNYDFLNVLLYKIAW